MVFVVKRMSTGKKGQIHLTPKLVIKVISVLFFAITVSAAIMSFYKFQATSKARDDARYMIDLGEGILSDRCLVQDRGFFNSEKLAGKPCVNTEGYEIQIEDSLGNTYLSTSKPPSELGVSEDELKAIFFPCAMNRTEENKVVACRLIVWVPE